MLAVDNFLSGFDDLKRHAACVTFNSEINGADGAVYPAISFEVPDNIKNDFVASIEAERGFKIDPKLIFLRANPEGSPEPYQAHNDLNMGSYTCILYLTSQGGTSLVRHIETGMDRNRPSMADVWAKDCNEYDAWEVTDYCEMAPNKALLFDAEMMHRGEPVSGYGQGNDSRMILVCFYDKAATC